MANETQGSTHNLADVPDRELKFEDGYIVDAKTAKPIGRLTNTKELADFVAGSKTDRISGDSRDTDRDLVPGSMR